MVGQRTRNRSQKPITTSGWLHTPSVWLTHDSCTLHRALTFEGCPCRSQHTILHRNLVGFYLLYTYNPEVRRGPPGNLVRRLPRLDTLLDMRARSGCVMTTPVRI